MSQQSALEATEGLLLVQRAFAAGGFGRGIGRTLGLAGEIARSGQVSLSGAPTPDHNNPSGSVHGGYIATLLDAAMALSVQTLLKAGVSYATTDLRISYVRALTAQNGKVTAEGSVLHLGRSMALAEAKLVDAHGALYAHATASFSLRRPS